MRIRYLFIALIAVVGLSYVGNASDSTYPLFALPNGVAVEATNPNAVRVPEPMAVDAYDIVEEPEEVVEWNSPVSSNSTLFWGHEAAALPAARILTYRGVTPPAVLGETCIPNTSTGDTHGNGRGVAFDPMDGNLWISRVTFFLPLPPFEGDGLIHKVSPPNVTPGSCPEVDTIPFGDGPGGTVQDDIGAIDVDEASKHLWVAGYKPIRVPPVTGGLRSYIYKVNRNNGKIINSCWVPFGGGGVGNDTLSSFRSTSLPGSSKYLLTDAGEIMTPTNGNMLLVIDQASCHSGRQATVVTTVMKTTPGGMTGIDFEWPGLLNSNGPGLFNNGDFSFMTPTFLGFTMTVTGELEDISLCGYRAKFGGDGNDACPY